MAPPPPVLVDRIDALLGALDTGSAEVDAALGTLAGLQAQAGLRAAAPDMAALATGEDPAWRPFEVRLPGGPGFVMVLESDSTAGYLDGSGHPLDEVLIRLMLALVGPGDRVLDLGANVGGFSLAAAAAGCAGLAVEASPTHAALLASAVWRNGFHHLHVVNAVADASPGIAEFVPNGPWGHVAWGPTPGSIQVPALAVEDLVAAVGWEGASFVKIDVEGSELEVLDGMRRLLQGPAAPPVLYESNAHALPFTGHTPRDLTEALERLGYHCYLVDDLGDQQRLTRIGPTDPQFQTVANCLALKGQPPDLAGWTVCPALTTEDLVAQVATEAVHPNPHCRLHVARALAEADPALLALPEVQATVALLADDPDESVRAAVVAL